MSFNRNQRRDHHSIGGGGGNRYSGGNNANRIGRGFGREFGSNYEQQHNTIGHSLQSSTVNPWAGSSTPESRPSLLPTPGSGNLLSQLTNTINSPEAQLLMASNLLSKLLTPANQSQSNVSSLLNMSGLGTNYANSNFSPREMDRGRNFNARRNEPYNKSSMGRRNQSNNKPRNAGQQNQNRNRNRPSSSPAKPLKKTDYDSKDSPDKKKKEDVKKEPEERKPQVKEEPKEDEPKVASAFHGIPRALLYCYVCHKHMWDDSSFENHVKGRPHEWMLSKLDESNKLVVDLLRHQVRVNEEQRRMKFQRSAKKKNRNSNNQKCEFCAMCDVDIRGSLAAHRRNYLHLKLKRFLHPKCLSCKKEFHNRLDFNLHKISADHLKVLAEKRRERRPDLKDDDYDLEDFVVLDDVGGSFTWGGDEACLTGEIKVSTKIEAEEDIEVSKIKDQDVEMKEDEEGDHAKEKDEAGKIPIYNPAAVVGSELLVNVSGKFCRACYRFMKTDEDAETHCRTVLHYENYRMFAKLQHAVSADKKVSNLKTEGGEENDVTERAEEEDEEAAGEDEEGADNVKKEVADVEMQNGAGESENHENDIEANEEVEMEGENEGKKYDPLEPTDDATESSKGVDSETKSNKGKTPPRATAQRGRRGGVARRGRN